MFDPGGAELRISSTINYMGPGAGHAILSIDGSSGARYRLDPACEVQFFAGPPKRNPIQFIRDLRRQIRELDPCVLLTYNWGATDAVIAARLDGRGPVIHNECGLSNEFDGRGRRRALARRIILSKVYRTVVVSETLRRLAIERFHLPPEKVRFIKTGVDIQRFRPGRNEELRAQIGPGPNGLVFGYMGTLKPTKNPGMLIRAFAAMERDPGDRLALFGDGPLRGELEVLARDLGVAGRVRFMGHFQDVSVCYPAIDVYVSASRSEQASNSLMEAMATGLPAVVTDIADNKILLADEQRPFILEMTDERGFTAAMRRLARDEGVRLHLGALNRRRCETELSLERMFREYSSLWEEAARSAGPCCDGRVAP